MFVMAIILVMSHLSIPSPSSLHPLFISLLIFICLISPQSICRTGDSVMVEFSLLCKNRLDNQCLG